MVKYYICPWCNRTYGVLQEWDVYKISPYYPTTPTQCSCGYIYKDEDIKENE